VRENSSREDLLKKTLGMSSSLSRALMLLASSTPVKYFASITEERFSVTA